MLHLDSLAPPVYFEAWIPVGPGVLRYQYGALLRAPVSRSAPWP